MNGAQTRRTSIEEKTASLPIGRILKTKPRVPAGRRKANTLLYLSDRLATKILPYLAQNAELRLKIIAKPATKREFKKQYGDEQGLSNIEWIHDTAHPAQEEVQAHQLARWADILVVVADAQLTSCMLHGYTQGLILQVLRCWDVSKKIILLPEMTPDQWRHPIGRRQQKKLQRKCDWIHVLRPALWDFTLQSYLTEAEQLSPNDLHWDWQGPEELMEVLYNEAQNVINIATRDASYNSPQSPLGNNSYSPPVKSKPALPAEIWTVILDYNGDWELATALSIYHHLPTPREWLKYLPTPPKPKSLEYHILTSPLPTIRTALSHSSGTLSPLATKLIFKFSLTPILTHLATHQKDIFWTSFALAVLPHKASVLYNSPTILEWWRTCPAVLKKEYGPEAMDGASRAGYVEVLDWWLASGLKLAYTEKALESASAKGHIAVLEWWKAAHESRKLTSSQSGGDTATDADLPLKVGKSILAAAQAGRADVLSWWETSRIPYAHEDGVARLASTHGHVACLRVWRELKGSKMIFDNQVLVGATKNGHADVLEWWRGVSRESGGAGVEYKTCDIEEAMEDAVGSGEGVVREWWAANGLNLGVGTGEWMKVKVL